MAVAEGEEQRPVVMKKLTGCASWVFEVVGILVLALGVVWTIRGDDGFIPLVIFGFLAAIVLLPARYFRRSTNISVWVYADHLVLRRKRPLLFGTKEERLDYKDIKKVRRVLNTGNSGNLILDLLFAHESYKVYRFNKPKMRLGLSNEIDYSLFLDYCENNGIEIED